MCNIFDEGNTVYYMLSERTYMIPCVKPITVPFELYPPHEMTVLEIRLPDFPDSAFRIWLPEMVSVSGRGEVYNQAIDGPQH